MWTTINYQTTKEKFASSFRSVCLVPGAPMAELLPILCTVAPLVDTADPLVDIADPLVEVADSLVEVADPVVEVAAFLHRP